MAATPFGMGYRMPAEWESHEGTWLAWPKNKDTFLGQHLAAVKGTFAVMARELCTGELVHVLVDDAEAQKEAVSLIGQERNLVFHRIRSADVWIRDYGPTFVKNSGVAAIKWTFNSWGRKYDDLLPDNETGEAVLQESGAKAFEAKMVLEGGSVDVNGNGVLLTTKQCLLNRNRNPELVAPQIEAMLREYLGATRIVWLPGGIEGDDTDGHVDDVARFVARDTVLCMTARRDSSNREVLEADLETLRKATDEAGNELKVVELEMPHPFDDELGRLPASYANFYIGNSVVLVPTFEDYNDRVALKTIERLFPTRRAVGIDCRSLVTGLGTIHCVTQQQPSTL